MHAKDAARKHLDSARDTLVGLSHDIHAIPELAFEEERAAARLCDALDRAGFEVVPEACDLPTAFVARTGSGPLHIGICAEYDALPGVGHACGHNIIAASSVGAALALQPLADEAGLTISVIGTPAEEGGGGKILMLERGGFDGVHAAMMVHPGPSDIVEMPIIAVAHFDVHYYGKESHASTYPELGINAADALTVAQTAIGLLRQHLNPRDRVHGIVTKGGEAPNIVPAHTTANYYVRAATLAELGGVREKVERCLESGAVATGCRMEIVDHTEPYTEMLHDARLAALYRRNAEALGRRFSEPSVRAEASTDMGNVSQQIPSIHPMMSIDSLPAVNHQPEFAAHCVSAAADKALSDAALAMAWTCIDAASDSKLVEQLTTPT